MYNSCKDVKFGTMNTRALDFIGAGAKSFQGSSFVVVAMRSNTIRCSTILFSLHSSLLVNGWSGGDHTDGLQA